MEQKRSDQIGQQTDSQSRQDGSKKEINPTSPAAKQDRKQEGTQQTPQEKGSTWSEKKGGPRAEGPDESGEENSEEEYSDARETGNQLTSQNENESEKPIITR